MDIHRPFSRDCGWPHAAPSAEVGQSGSVRRTVLIIDDHAVFRQFARDLLESDGFQVVGEAATGGQGIEMAGRLAPDVVLVDVQLPDIDGFAVADRLAVAGGDAAVVLISSRDSATYGDRVAQAPACGFLDKAELAGPALERMLEPPPSG